MQMKRMIEFQSMLAVCLLGLLVFMPMAAAQSLWSSTEDGTSYSGLFADRKARNVGDVLTVVISEKTTTTASKSNANSKSGSQTLNAGTGIFDFLLAERNVVLVVNAAFSILTDNIHQRIDVYVILFRQLKVVGVVDVRLLELQCTMMANHQHIILGFIVAFNHFANKPLINITAQAAFSGNEYQQLFINWLFLWRTAKVK